MAKLIGHLFTSDAKRFVTFEVDGLKETTKQYTKTQESENTTPRYAYNYWHIMPKSQLGQLKEEDGFISVKSFTMYDTTENMFLFKKMVFDVLSEKVVKAKIKYECIVDMLGAVESSLLYDDEEGQ